MKNARYPKLVIVGMSALAAAILLLQALLHGHLTGLDEYDDGVYFASAMQLIHGAMPYRDFGFIQPPFVAVLLSPFALASRLVGTAHAFEAARLFIVAIAAANVALVGVLLRRRSLVELVGAMAVMTVYPGAINSAQTVLLEPILVLLCLLGLVTLFEGDRTTEQSRRVIVAGVFFGVAMSTKLWAAIPIVVVTYLLWHGDRHLGQLHRTRRFLLGAVGGFWLICLPFAVGAPRAFFDQIFVTQFNRPASGYLVDERIIDISGTVGLLHLFTRRFTIGTAIVVIAILAVIAFIAYSRSHAPVSELERMALISAVFVGLILVTGSTYYYHYSGFEAPFIALVAGFVAGRLLGAPARQWKWRPPLPVRGSVARVALVFFVVAVAISGNADILHIARGKQVTQVSDILSASVPDHGCLLSANPSLALLDNRYTADDTGCPDVVDYVGVERIYDNGYAAAPSDRKLAALQHQLMAWVRASDTLIMNRALHSWGQQVASYVAQHFVTIHERRANSSVYVRRSHSSA